LVFVLVNEISTISVRYMQYAMYAVYVNGKTSNEEDSLRISAEDDGRLPRHARKPRNNACNVVGALTDPTIHVCLFD
jgi:hypothetical protein